MARSITRRKTRMAGPQNRNEPTAASRKNLASPRSDLTAAGMAPLQPAVDAPQLWTAERGGMTYLGPASGYITGDDHDTLGTAFNVDRAKAIPARRTEGEETHSAPEIARGV